MNPVEEIEWTGKTLGVVYASRMPRIPLSLFIVGQSVRVCHRASLFDAETRARPLGLVAGIMLMSGYDNAVAPLPRNISACFRTDITQRVRSSRFWRYRGSSRFNSVRRRVRSKQSDDDLSIRSEDFASSA